MNNSFWDLLTNTKSCVNNNETPMQCKASDCTNCKYSISVKPKTTLLNEKMGKCKKYPININPIYL